MHGGSNPEPNKRGYTEGLPRCVQRERVSARLYDIELDDPVPPVQIQPHRIPHTMKTAVHWCGGGEHCGSVQEKLQAMEKDGWIAKVDTPTEWLPFLEVTPSESCCHYGKEHQMQRSQRHQ